MIWHKILLVCENAISSSISLKYIFSNSTALNGSCMSVRRMRKNTKKENMLNKFDRFKKSVFWQWHDNWQNKVKNWANENINWWKIIYPRAPHIAMFWTTNSLRQHHQPILAFFPTVWFGYNILLSKLSYYIDALRKWVSHWLYCLSTCL